MSVMSMVQSGGWGAISVYFATYLILLQEGIAEGQAAIMLSALPPLALILAVVILNHQLNEFWAGGNLKQSSEEIEQITGDRDNYHSASQEIQQHIDDFDYKALGHHVTILSGLLIAAVAPIIATMRYGVLGFVIGLFCSFIPIIALSRGSYIELNRLAENLSTPYKEKYENQ